jgi:CCR4-NOT transcription complex subunit 1
LQFLEGLAKPLLQKLILHETYVKSAKLLNDENTLANPSDRAALKHLGSWLGRITLARDRPIRFKNLSLKDLLIEGYDQQRLLLAIPYACKILEATKSSTIFKAPHNPWLMPILGLLIELYYQAELKLNQKFEIEVLFKDLDLLMDEFEPTSLLRTRPRGAVVTEILDDDSQVGVNGTGASYGDRSGNTSGTGAEGMPGPLVNDPELGMYLDSLLLELRSRLYFEHELEPYAQVPRILRMIQNVFENATRETCVSILFPFILGLFCLAHSTPID